MIKTALFIAVAALLQIFPNKVFGQNFTQSNLPIVQIQTNGQAIQDEPKIMATMKIIARTDGKPNQINDPANAYNGWIGIEYRGSTSQWFDKKPYGIETRNADTSDRAVELLGMPAETDWALIAPMNDKSLLRDVLAYRLAADATAGGVWTPRTRLVELVLNGNYEGVYILLEKIKRGKNRVNIAKLEAKDTTDPKITGGYLLSMDKVNNNPGGDWESNYPPFNGSQSKTYFQINYPKPENRVQPQFDHIKNYLDDFEKAIADWQPNSGGLPEYEKWIDVDSWINYLLVNEISKNTDGYRLSAYFHKDRDDRDPLLKMGPVWDFNIAFGMANYCEGEFHTGWAKDFNDYCGGDWWVIHFWWKKICSDTNFQKKTAARWKELRANEWSDNRLDFVVDSLTALIAEPQVRNFQRWQILGQYLWPNAYVGQTWQQEIDYLKNWLKNRVEWMDNNIAALDPTSLPPYPFLDNARVFPNPVQADTAQDLLLEYNSNDFAGATFSLFDEQGRQVMRSEKLPAGKRIQHKISLPPLSAGVFFYTISIGEKIAKRGKIVVAAK